MKSPWLCLPATVGDLHSIAISHGEGRFVAPQHVIDELDYERSGGVPVRRSERRPVAWTSRGTRTAPCCAIEGITSPDGRVLGKMGHTERYSPFVGKNIYGEKYQPLFANGVKYFK